MKAIKSRIISIFSDNHGQKLLRHENYQPFSLLYILLSSLAKGSPLFPLFQYWKQINIHETFCNIVWGEVVTTDEKDVFIQIQSSIDCSKALVLLNCLNTFVHD